VKEDCELDSEWPSRLKKKRKKKEKTKSKYFKEFDLGWNKEDANELRKVLWFLLQKDFFKL